MRLYSIPEVAKHTKKSVSTIRHAIYRNKIVVPTYFYRKDVPLFSGEQVKEIQKQINIKESGITF